MTNAPTFDLCDIKASPCVAFQRSAGYPCDEVIGTPGVDLAVTARSRIDEALRVSEERFRQLVENIDEVFWTMDMEMHRMAYVSPGYEAIWGRTCQSLYDSPDSWTQSIHELDRDRVVQAAKDKLRSATYDETYRILRPDGTVRWVRDRSFPVGNESGVVRRVFGIVADVTERKKLEDKCLHGQRLESIGMLATGIAHDLANVLAPVAMAAPLLRAHASRPSDIRLLATLERSAERGGALVRQILSFVHGMDEEPRIVQVRHLLDDIMVLVAETFPKSIVLRGNVANDLWPILANPTQIHQVLLNLCVNARDAMPQGGTLHLRAKNLMIDEVTAREIKGTSPGAWLMVEIGDTGTGIPPDVLPRMWEPFFTTKAAGKGAGVGLTTVRSIVTSHHGFIALQTECGRGTNFRVYLPAAESGSVAISDIVPPPAARGRNELILLVDDEEMIRQTATAVFTRAGYQVLTAADGASGAALFVARASEIALVITDCDMPVVNGEAFARIVRRFSPATKILSISGLDPSVQPNGATGQKYADAFLVKPFSAHTLLAAVAELVGGDAVGGSGANSNNARGGN